MFGLRNSGLLAACFGSALALAAVGACSSSPSSKEDASAGGASGSGGATTSPDKLCSDPGVTCATPPTDPGTPDANGTTPTVLAISKLFLGDTDRQGKASLNAWKSYGYDIDGIVSTKTGTNHCKLQKGSNPASDKPDGKDGIDNSFGANLLPIIMIFAPKTSASVNKSITDGKFTVIFKMDNLDSQANQTKVTSELFGGANMGSAPKWDGTDKWPVVPELLNNGNINDPKVKFPSSYVSDNTWVSGSRGDLALNLAVQGRSLTLDIVHAVITMKLTSDHASASDGIIAGVIDTETLIAQLRMIAGSFSPTMCTGSTFDNIAQQIRDASDIMHDGTNGDPTKTCDAISIGLGFNAKVVQLGSVAAPAKSQPDPCSDAGTGGSGGSGGSGGTDAGTGGSSAGGTDGGI